VHPRNAMSLTNVVYNSTLNWANPVLSMLHAQALIPMFGEFPIELGWSDHEAEILDRLRRDGQYVQLFAAAWPGEADPFNADRVAKAIAAFEATLISGNSAYDQSTLQGKRDAMSPAARRGQELFFSERMECFHCHGGFNFSQSVSHAGTTITQTDFFNNGLYNIGGTGDYPLDNRGLWEFTQQPADMGRFRPPTLRNIELTAPYMHDGSIATLDEVLDHYARGGRLISSGPFAGDGAKNPYKSELIVPFILNTQEKQDLIAFLNSLTDWDFICDPRVADPFGNFPRHARCP
jgi:cytochrome c peroxidase